MRRFDRSDVATAVCQSRRIAACRRALVTAVFCWCAAEVPTGRAGQPGGDDKVPEGKATLHRMLDESAEQYSLYADADRQQPLKLRCVLRWANVTRGSADGATYIWTRKGRPLATVCVYPWAGRLCDNFQSLAEGPITAVRHHIEIGLVMEGAPIRMVYELAHFNAEAIHAASRSFSTAARI